MPDPAGDKIFKDFTVPLGNVIQNPNGYMGANEFIVYQTN